MGLNSGYRTYRNDYVDNGEAVTAVLTQEFLPDFKSRHTMQVWNVSAGSASNNNHNVTERWQGETLVDRSLHEIFIANNSSTVRTVFFHPLYKFIDEQQPLPLLESPIAPPAELTDYFQVQIPANSSAHYYASAINEGNNLILVMRGGSQDTRG